MLLFLLACAPSPLPGVATTKAVRGDSYTLAEDAEMDDVWVLERDGGQTCDDLDEPGWSVRPLFGTGSLPPGLARFCRFTRTTGPASDLSSLGASPDLAVVAPLTEGTPETLAANYVARVGSELLSDTIHLHSAIEAFENIGPAAESYVWPALESDSVVTQVRMIQLLGRIGTEQSIAKLEAIRSGNPFESDIVRAIEEIRNAQRTPESW